MLIKMCTLLLNFEVATENGSTVEPRYNEVRYNKILL